MDGDIVAETEPRAWYLKSKSPVYWPPCEALTLPEDEFGAYLKKIMEGGLEGIFKKTDTQIQKDKAVADAHGADDDTFTLVSDQPSTTADIRQALGGMDIDTDSASTDASDSDQPDTDTQTNPFMAGLRAHAHQDASSTVANKMLTENGAPAHRSTTNALVDLFFELEDVISGPRLRELLAAAWSADPLATLKLVFNARSIHLGKSSRATFYRCAGWLAAHHPLTLAANLAWLSRPVVEKKAAAKQTEDETVIVDNPSDEADPTRFDVRHGVAHGYWKDLLNVLVLSANGALDVLSDPRDLLNVENETEAGPRQDRREVERARHAAAVEKFTADGVHHALHLTVARLFAAQLGQDLALLDEREKEKKEEGKVKGEDISLCAKWAPSPARFHDKHTFVASSIAEIMFPPSRFPPDLIGESRDVYLRHAREEYRRSLTRLRARLDVVERHLTTGKFAEVDYARVPSQAMRVYAPLFAEKDPDRFGGYLLDVQKGKASISGAVLMPGVLVKEALAGAGGGPGRLGLQTKKKRRAYHRGRKVWGKASRVKGGAGAVLAKTAAEMSGRVLDAQWEALVRRVRESGTLESCVAVCDVSGSMGWPAFPDGTTPMHSAIGLSLLMAEVTRPPFGGAFVTFSAKPTVELVDLTQTLREKVEVLKSSSWGMNTNLGKVFDLLLRVAVENQLEKGDMVRRVFVFSDMQFDAAVSTGRDGWETTYERIEARYAEAGYEMPEVVFWNLAGGRAGQTGVGDPIAPKPVTSAQRGVAMVSGYSQGLLKVFMDKGVFGDEEEVVETVDGKDGVQVVKRKKELDPESLMRRAIGHKAYEMLAVVD